MFLLREGLGQEVAVAFNGSTDKLSIFRHANVLFGCQSLSVTRQGCCSLGSVHFPPRGSLLVSFPPRGISILLLLQLCSGKSRSSYKLASGCCTACDAYMRIVLARAIFCSERFWSISYCTLDLVSQKVCICAG